MIFFRLCLICAICLLLQPCPGAAAAPQPGVIEGSLSYPSEFIPPGDYHVYAYLPDPAKWGSTFSRDHRAYYSKYVKCGMSGECLDHTPIVVNVKSGETVSGIDPQDWYK